MPFSKITVAPSSEEQLLPADAAVFLRVTEAQLEKMHGARIGPRFVLIKVSGVDHVRYAKHDLEDWLAANKTGMPVAKAPSKK